MGNAVTKNTNKKAWEVLVISDPLIYEKLQPTEKNIFKRIFKAQNPYGGDLEYALDILYQPVVIFNKQFKGLLANKDGKLSFNGENT